MPAKVWTCHGDYEPAVKLPAGSPAGRHGLAVLSSTPPLDRSGPQKVTVAIQTDMQVAPQPHGPAVCLLENEDLDRRIPNVWGFQLLDSVTTQPLTESNPSTPLVNFTPLSKDRGLSSYPLQRPSSPRLTVSGPSAAPVTISGPSTACFNNFGPSAVRVTTIGSNTASVVTPDPCVARFTISGSSVVYSTLTGPSADHRRLSTPPTPPTSAPSASLHQVFPPSNPFALECKQSLA